MVYGDGYYGEGIYGLDVGPTPPPAGPGRTTPNVHKDCVCGDGWRFEATDLSTGRVKAVLHPLSVSWDDNLSQVGSFQMDLSSRELSAQDIWPHMTGIFISRFNDDRITRTGYFGGIVEAYSGGVSGITTIGGYSIDEYLYHRLIAGPNSGTQYKVNKRQTKIARDLVNIYAGYQEPEIPRESWVPITAEAIPGDVIRQVNYREWEFKNIGQAIQELVEAEDGLEYRLSHIFDENTGTWRSLMTFADEIGEVRELTLRSDIEGWEYGVTVDAKDHATWTYGTGAGEKSLQLEAIAYDPTNIYPYFQVTKAWKDAKEQDALNPLAKGWTKYHRDPVAVPSITIAGLDQPRPDEMQTGDTVNVDIEYGIITFKDQARILATGWALTNDAPVKRTLTLMPIIRPSKAMLTQQPINPETPTEGGPVAEPTPGLVVYVNDRRLDEISGMQKADGFNGVYVHNDEDGDPQVYLVSLESGSTVGTIKFTTPLPSDADPESIRLNPKNGKIVLFDGGNNDADRDTFKFYVFDDVGPGAHTVTPTVHTMQYPGGAKLNAETLMIRPTDGRYFIVTKASPAGQLFSYIPGAATAVNLNKPMPSNVSDGTFSKGGGFAFLRSADRNNIDVFSTKTWAKVGEIVAPAVAKGESMSLVNNGKALLIGTEGLNSPIYKVLVPKKYRDEIVVASTPGTATYPADIFGKNWKLTLPIN